jgi:transcription antitermination protein NusB
MASRRKAREAALQMLFQMDVSGVSAERAIVLFWSGLGNQEDDETRQFANQLARGCAARQEAIDKAIRSVSEHWRLERMARVDRNILRLGVYELIALREVPRKVTLNEAVELAKRFGDENSPSFVNGVLDRIAADQGKD